MNNVVLIGFMGSGKTTVGRHLADQLKRPFIDLDQAIEAGSGPIAEIFSREGESRFREIEARELGRVLAHDDRAVIAVGGGAPLPEENWWQIRTGNTVVALMAEPAELARRLDGGNGRPLLGTDAPAAIARLLPDRMSRYMDADLIVATDGRSPERLAAEITKRLPRGPLTRIAVEVPGSEHDVIVGSSLTGLIGSAVHRLRPSGTVVVVTDGHLVERYAVPLARVLKSFALDVAIHVVPPGEAAKDIAVLAGIYDALAHAGVDRHGVMVSLGGGTVGDVAGLAAATWMRGIRYLQVPTTLLAMVDSSIGGKTAINLAAGKNMVGAVHQPAAIFCDLCYLDSLPENEFRASLAEVIKAALIADRALADWLDSNMPSLLARDPGAVQEAVARSIAIKAGVVGRDPNETGLRAILNYGHTVGHALERALGYGRIRHGEAVAWGMEVGARISVLSESCAPAVADRQHRLLEAANLLSARPDVSRASLLDALRHDKKRRDGEPRWVLLRAVGEAEYGRQVDADLVARALSEVLAL